MTSEHYDTKTRTGVLSRWAAIASGRDPDYDEQGRFMVKGASGLKRWLMAEGGFDRKELE